MGGDEYGAGARGMQSPSSPFKKPHPVGGELHLTNITHIKVDRCYLNLLFLFWTQASFLLARIKRSFSVFGDRLIVVIGSINCSIGLYKKKRLLSVSSFNKLIVLRPIVLQSVNSRQVGFENQFQSLYDECGFISHNLLSRLRFVPSPFWR